MNRCHDSIDEHFQLTQSQLTFPTRYYLLVLNIFQDGPFLTKKLYRIMTTNYTFIVELLSSPYTESVTSV
jgi:hypothetical protein